MRRECIAEKMKFELVASKKGGECGRPRRTDRRHHARTIVCAGSWKSSLVADASRRAGHFKQSIGPAVTQDERAKDDGNVVKRRPHTTPRQHKDG